MTSSMPPNDEAKLAVMESNDHAREPSESSYPTSPSRLVLFGLGRSGGDDEGQRHGPLNDSGEIVVSKAFFFAVADAFIKISASANAVTADHLVQDAHTGRGLLTVTVAIAVDTIGYSATAHIPII